jgi:hypothetical protein
MVVHALFGQASMWLFATLHIDVGGSRHHRALSSCSHFCLQYRDQAGGSRFPQSKSCSGCVLRWILPPQPWVLQAVGVCTEALAPAGGRGLGALCVGW